MPKIRVLNPRRKRNKKKYRKSRARHSTAKRRKNVRRRSNVHRKRVVRRRAVKRARRRRNPGAGELLIFGNPRHMAKRRKRVNRKRKHNPRRKFYAKAHNVHHRRRHHNPRISSDLVKSAVWASAGAIVTRAGTQAILQDKNAGWMGYLGNGVVAFGLSWLGERFISAQAGDGILLGGVIGLVLRVAKEQIFASSPLAAQLSLQGLGDADFALSGYVNDPFALPTTSEGADQLTVTPNSYWARPVVVAPARGLQGYDVASMGGRGGPVVDRWKSPWG